MPRLEEGILEDSEIYYFQPSDFAKKALFALQHIGIFHCDERYAATHPYWESILLIFIDSGLLETRYGGRQFTAGPGDAVLIDCRYPHRYAARSDLRFHYFHFTGSSSQDYCSLIREIYGSGYLKGACSTETGRIFRNMMHQVRTKGDRENEHRISVYIHMILCALVEAGTDRQAGTRRTMDQVITYMQDHLTENLSIEDMASAAGLSRYYFNRLFRQQTGVSPHRYFNNLRIQKARLLLHTTDDSVAQIAEACGFDNVSNFIRLFRSCTDMTPTAFRGIPF